LFLAAGSVIHELAHLKEKSGAEFDHQDIQNMGGLRQKMPVTFFTMLLASLALAGIPFTSGFLSKDAILIQTFAWADANASWTELIPYAALLTSWLTAFYIARLIFKVFFGKLRLASATAHNHIHEAPGAMKYVLIALALFCLFPAFAFNPFHYDHSWLYEAFETNVWPPGQHQISFSTYELLIPVLVSSISVVLIIVAYKQYTKPVSTANSGNFLVNISRNQWYIDEIYQFVFVKGITKFSAAMYSFDKAIIDGVVNLSAKVGLFLSLLSEAIDRYIIDGLVNGAASLAKTIGNFARHFQTGRLQHYMLAMILAVLTFFLIQYFSQAI
jgi:NADH-quinone oxidoreductase subunit L